MGLTPSGRTIRNEGAEVDVVGGSYDHAVARAARYAQAEQGLLVQDTSWDGYTDVPGWIVEGYATLFAEIDEQLPVQGLGRPDLVVVPVGVGSLLQAALMHYRRPDVTVADAALADAANRCAAMGTAVVSVEAAAAACLAESLLAGRPVTVETGATVMAGLNCGTPSALAWPFILNGLDAATSVTDDDTLCAARDLGAVGVPAGPCGAASLAAARLALTGPDGNARRGHLQIGPNSTVVLVCTEGTDANPLPGTT